MGERGVKEKEEEGTESDGLGDLTGVLSGREEVEGGGGGGGGGVERRGYGEGEGVRGYRDRGWR